MSCLKITALNLDIQWKNRESNFDSVSKNVRSLETDVLLLPEMFSTGFYMKPEEIADRDGTTLQWMKNLAKSYDFAVAGSVSIAEGNQFFNRFYFVEPSGKFHSYDKRHLFSYSGEDKVYSKGENRIVIFYKGVRFLLQVCYDLRFPVFSRSKKDYDVILYVANWPDTRVDAWRTLLKARAIENQAYVFGVNRVGEDGNNLKYEESTDCYFADGSIVSEKNDVFVSACIKLDELELFRKKFQFLNDADSFQLNI